MTAKQFRTATIKRRFRGWKYVFIILKVSDVQPLGDPPYRHYKLRELNPYNPLSYIVAVPLALLSVFMVGVPETISDIKRAFKYR